MKKWRAMLPMVLGATLVLSACSGNGGNGGVNGGGNDGGAGNGAASSGSETAGAGNNGEGAPPEVELIWYYGVSQVSPDQDQIEEAVNELVKAKLNATVELRPIDFGSYTTKLNTASAAGEKFDLVWTANWAFNYDENVKKGAFLPLDELLAEYAPSTQEAIPSFTWDATRYKGEIYAVPNYQTVTSRYGASIRKDLADKYGFDAGTVEKIEDLEPFLKLVKDNDPDLTPLMLTGPGTKFEPFMYGYDDSGVKIGDTSFKVNFMEETPEYERFVYMMHDWFEKGYINDDASTVKQIDSMYNGKYAAGLESAMKPGYEAEKKTSNGGYDVIGIPFTEATTRRTSNITTMTAISRTSANPERAMQLIELVNTDPELFNLLSFGIEGEHYEKIDDNTVRIDTGGGYTAQNWVFGNVFNGYLVEGQAPDTWEKTRELNESAYVQPTFGFSFDDSNVKAEAANVAAVKAEYEPLLMTGTVDPEEYLPEYLEKLRGAGAEKVLAEQQKQLDAWVAENVE
ncbi:ABC transporter substrate-binding protein [Paenibacillus sp. IB182496]|uniref:ABC transporter substrate-binding protein n=1 Tax=Paenibacillus sabuli TaxID=2772509 RepID=A0A927BZN2_9BACL|nr:ABC transporter substrate-binding protein [Paenibacillus sabuli]MBD2848434.1 ABC transporter substrate-binding protein [Paenibacillus sabuli]